MIIRIKEFIVNIFVTLIVLVSLCFILDKTILLISYPIIKNLPFAQDTELSPYGIELKPNFTGRFATAEYNISIKTNSLGFRNEELSIDKQKGIFRILCLGDSFTFGQGVEFSEAYPKVLEKILNEKMANKGISFEVINAGWVASNPKKQLSFFKNYGFRFKPNILIIGFFTGNDIVELLSSSMSPLQAIEFQANFVTALRLRRGMVGVFRAGLERLFPNLYEFISLRIIKLIYKMGGYRHTFDYILIKDYPEIVKSGWNQTFNYFREMNRIARENNTKLFVVIIPFREQTKDINYGENYISDKPQRILKEFLIQENISFYDLLPYLKRYKTEQIYYLKDGHWRAKGHSVVAKKIFDEFVNKCSFLNKQINQISQTK